MITSLTNEKVKYVRSLYRRNMRQGERTFVIEGVRLFEEALASGAAIKLALYDEETLSGTERGRALLEKLRKAPFESWSTSPKVLESAAETVSPQGIVAAVAMPEWQYPELSGPSLVVILDGLQDPGNLGTIMRSAEASGVKAILLTPDCVDLFNPKVVRAAMGAHFRLPSFPDTGWDGITRMLGEGTQIVVTEAGADTAYYDIDWRRPSGLVIGNEAHGIGPAARKIATVRAAIPMVGGAESLNAGVAGSIIMFEALRQRVTDCPDS